MPPPRKKRPPAGQSVPDAGTIFAHRDALRRSSGAAGQKPPERGRKNSPRRSRRLCAGCAPWGNGGQWGCLVPGKHRTGHPVGQGGTSGRKNSPGVGRRLCAGCAHGREAGDGGVWCRESTALGARRDRGHARAQKQPRRGPGTVRRLRPMGEWRAIRVSGSGKAPHWVPAGAEGIPGRKNSPRRRPEAVWMRDMGVTCPGRSV